MDEHDQPSGVPPRPEPRPRTRSWSAIGAGWGKALEWAAVTALVAGLLAEGVLFLADLASNASDRPSSITLARLAWSPLGARLHPAQNPMPG